MASRYLILAGAIAVVALLAWGVAAVSRRARELQDQEMGLLDHLRELRYRVLAALGSVAVLTVLLFSFDVQPVTVRGYALWAPIPTVAESLATRLLNAILAYSLPEHVSLTVLTASEALVAQLQAAVLGGIVLGSPFVAYHVAAFLAPALRPNERRTVAGLMPVSLALFLAGVAFGFFLMVPITLATLYAYAEPIGATALAQPQQTLSFVLLTTALFGVAFELPLIMAGLAYMGLVHPSTMGRHWRGVVVGVLILGAILSDPSPITQVLIAGPVILLYLIGLGTARLAYRRGRRSRLAGTTDG